MSEYPQVTSERVGETHELTVRRSEYRKHVFHLLDKELEPVIEHLQELQEPRRGERRDCLDCHGTLVYDDSLWLHEPPADDCPRDRMTVTEAFFGGLVLYSEYRDENVQLMADGQWEGYFVVGYLGDSQDDGARLARETIEARIESGEWVVPEEQP